MGWGKGYVDGSAVYVLVVVRWSGIGCALVVLAAVTVVGKVGMVTDGREGCG